jgi:hypothetical protein
MGVSGGVDVFFSVLFLIIQIVCPHPPAPSLKKLLWTPNGEKEPDKTQSHQENTVIIVW